MVNLDKGQIQSMTIIEIPSKPPVLGTKLLRVAAYCRVSTKTEQQTGSLETQERYYTTLIAEHPDWELAGIFSDDASGLSTKNRPSFRKMMTKCRQGKIDLILTKSISRFGRNTLDMLVAIRELRDLNVEVFFEAQQIKISDRRNDRLIDAYCAYAQSESESKSANIRWGIKRGFETASIGYSDIVCYGYIRDEKNKLAISEPEAAIVRKKFALAAERYSLGRISKELHGMGLLSPRGKAHWSKETIKKILLNEKYAGQVLLQKTYVGDVLVGKQVKNTGQRERYLIQNHHPAIIEIELFNRVQSLFDGAKTF